MSKQRLKRKIEAQEAQLEEAKQRVTALENSITSLKYHLENYEIYLRKKVRRQDEEACRGEYMVILPALLSVCSITMEEYLGNIERRKREFVIPRQMAAYYLYTEHEFSDAPIAKVLKKDRTTTINSRKKHIEDMKGKAYAKNYNTFLLRLFKGLDEEPETPQKPDPLPSSDPIKENVLQGFGIFGGGSLGLTQI